MMHHQAPLGRVYLTTAPALDPLRNLFTFDTDALESYELGRYDHALELPEHLKPPPMLLGGGGGTAATAVEGVAAAPEIQMELTKVWDWSGLGPLLAKEAGGCVRSCARVDRPVAHPLAAHPSRPIPQLQNMMLVFHDRISTLEKALKKANNARSGSAGKSTPSSSSLAALADENSPPPVSGSNKRKKPR